MSTLAGKSILVVEDEALLAMMVAEFLENSGATVVGPAATLDKGLALARDGRIDVGLLDVNIRGERIDPIAAVLFSRGIPIVFTTGYGKRPPGPWLNAPIIDKPFAEETVLRAIKQALQAD
jgi:DNA-binding response OmpR family regulator